MREAIIEKFLKEVPEFRNIFRENCTQNLVDSEDGIYVLWGLGIMPGVIKFLRQPEMYKKQLQNIFAFFEKMANSERGEIRELLMYSTLETLDDYKDILTIAYTFMGNKTKELLNNVQNFLGE